MAFELSEAYVQLSERGFDLATKKVDSFEQAMVELDKIASEATKSVEEGFAGALDAVGKKLDEVGKKTEKTSEKIDKATKSTGSSAGGVADQFEDINEMIDGIRGDLDRGREQIDDWKKASGGISEKWMKSAATIARIAGIVTFVAGAAKKVYDWVYKASLEWSGFNDAAEESIILSQKLLKQNERMIRQKMNQIKLNENLVDRERDLKDLQSLLKKEADNAAEALKQAQDAMEPGALGQWYDGKLNEQLPVDLKNAEDAAKSAENALESVSRAIEEVQQESNAAAAEFEKMMNASFNPQAQEEQSLRDKGFSEGRISEFRQRKAAERRYQKEEQLKQMMADQAKEIELQIIALEKGEEAAARQADIYAGLDKTSVSIRANMREELRMAQAAAEARERTAEADISERWRNARRG